MFVLSAPHPRSPFFGPRATIPLSDELLSRSPVLPFSRSPRLRALTIPGAAPAGLAVACRLLDRDKRRRAVLPSCDLC